MFCKSHTSALKKGKYRCKLWPGVEGSVSQTPGKINQDSEVARLEKFMRKYDRGDIKHNDWLDTLAFEEIEKIRQVIDT